MGAGVERHAPAALPPGSAPGAENLSPTGTRSPKRPALSESLYRISYSVPIKNACMIKLVAD